MSEKATIILPDKTIELPIISGSTGERAIDIQQLRAQTGYITLDPGFVNSGSCTSEITFIDGEKGILLYRGYPIEQLAEKCSFLEVAYLLIKGHLPSRSELNQFTTEITRHTLLHEDIKGFFDGFPRNAHPMAILASVVSSLSTFYQNDLDENPEMVHLNIIRLLAKLPTIAAYAYKKSIGQPLVYPDNARDYCENFLYMMFSMPVEEYKVEREFIEALNMLLILHADHEQNCSTSTVRVVRSSMANIFACIAAGICALWGHRHGGANEEVINMLEGIRANGRSVKHVIEQAKDKNSNFRLMGFGHRVYKNFDPRAKLIKGACDRLLKSLKVSDPLLDTARELEEAALKDQYFVDRKLYPNVDFYSGIIYRAMGIPVSAFTVMFALGRLPGWLAHCVEFTSDPSNKISRPRQIYSGAEQRNYVPIDQR